MFNKLIVGGVVQDATNSHLVNTNRNVSDYISLHSILHHFPTFKENIEKGITFNNFEELQNYKWDIQGHNLTTRYGGCPITNSEIRDAFFGIGTIRPVFTKYKSHKSCAESLFIKLIGFAKHFCLIAVPKEEVVRCLYELYLFNEIVDYSRFCIIISHPAMKLPIAHYNSISLNLPIYLVKDLPSIKKITVEDLLTCL